LWQFGIVIDEEEVEEKPVVGNVSHVNKVMFVRNGK
jgi:hypothetical protein